MSRPVDAGSVAERVYPEFAPVAYAEEEPYVDFALLKYLGGIGRSIQAVEDLVRDPDRPVWAKAVDLNTSPLLALPWLGQFVGSTPPQQLPGESDVAYEARFRTHIASVRGWKRGTPASLRAALQAYLTGSKQVTILERDTSPYHFSVTTRLSETPTSEWPTTNLVLNGGVETNATGWSGSGAAARSTNKAKSGGASYKFQNLGGVNDSAQVFITAGFAVGDVLTLSAYVNPDVTLTMNAQINQNNNVPTLLDFAEGPPVVCPAGVWTRVSVTRTVVVGATNIYLYVTTYGVQPVCDVYVDDAQIEKQPQATPYVHTDGASASRVAGGTNILKAIIAEKPAGLQFTYAVVPAWTYNDIDAAYATYNAIDAGNTTYDDIDNGP